MGEPDNLRPSSRRPLGVASDDLERALRETLSRAADPAQAVGSPDPGSRAIRKGRRISRRRSVVGAALVAAATAAATVGVVQLNPDGRYAGPAWVADPDPPINQSLPAVAPTTAVPAPLGTFDGEKLSATDVPVDLVVSSQLRTTTGTAIMLPQIGTVTQAHETTKGWLVVGVPPAGGATLWYVAPDGSSLQVLPAVDAVALAPDGRRVAWRDSARLFSAIVDKGTLTDAMQTSAPSEGLPVSFVGHGVVMERTGAGERAGFDVWWPRRGRSYTPVWKPGTSEIYGPLPDGRTVVGQVSAEVGDRPCLALMDAVNALTVLKTACTLQLNSRGAGTVSPDGHWLVADGAGRARLVDLDLAFTGRASAADAGPRLGDQAAWASGDTLVHVSSEGELMRVTAGKKPKVVEVPVPGADANDRVLVVDPMLV
jgi:hypothetical protein